MEILPQQLFQNLNGFRPLQVDLPHFRRDVPHHAGHARGQGGKIAFRTGGVDHQEKAVLGQPVDNEVVKHAAPFIQQEAVTASALPKRVQIMGHGEGELFRSVFSLKHELPHVADIKNGSPGSGMSVFCQNSFVLDGHVPSGERSHARPVAFVPGG